MASSRLVSQAKHTLAEHYKLRPPTTTCSWTYETWAREFVEILADYDFTVGGKRDEEVKTWVDDVEDMLEPLANPSWLLWGASVLRRMSKEVNAQDPANGSDPESWEDMRKYFAVPSWDYLVDTIHRVERTQAGEILVYFTSRHGEKIKESGNICKIRLPKKLLAFYEEHLRWDDNVVNAHF